MMPLLIRLFCFLFFFSATESGLAVEAYAHGTGHRLLDAEHPVAISFFYVDETPMTYAEVLVFSPDDRKVEHQNCRTDKNGIFAFLPNAPGEWLIRADDGMGHAAEAVVEVKAKGSSDAERAAVAGPKASSGSSSKTVRIIAGLSLILNLSLVGLLFQRRRKPRSGRPA
jgi:nickel transport protein